jgi:hypothetical protein
LVEIDGGRPKWWLPTYQTPKGTVYQVDEASCSECPVSLLDRHRQLRRLVDIVSTDRAVKNGTGAVMFGPDSGRWPAEWYDAVALFTNYLNLEALAEQEAFHHER